MRPTKRRTRADQAHAAWSGGHPNIAFFGATKLVPNVVRPAIHKSASVILAAALICVLLPGGLCAQVDEQTGDPGVATPLSVCEDDGQGTSKYTPCEAYIDGNLKNQADTIKWILGRITRWKVYAQQVSDSYLRNDEISQWIIIVLSFLTTISAAVTKLYPDLNIRKLEFAIVPIVLSSLIAAVTSVGAYYKFDEYRSLSQSMADDLTELEADINFVMLRYASSQRQESVNDDTINDWHERLNTIIQRYSQRETGDGI